ncbi:hypothetical protein B0I35DRAFT_415716 [Stachybotrys elegans]|uniref:Uncharacterized protein n=1 Tax=Stachybotrys elegans TaxID=80388 RepID=A0A8K0WW38_9HYPO|nr:hypothetical protein B0I35DRAFT_415716 [Stachybotrys elegans]
MTAEHGSEALRDENLLVLADCVASMEIIITTMLYMWYKNVIDGNKPSSAETRDEARREMLIIDELHVQYDAMRKGRQGFSTLYLENERFLYFWVNAYDIIIQLAGAWDEDPSVRSWMQEKLVNFENDAIRLSRHIVAMGEHNVINSATKTVLRRKWEVVKLITALHHKHRGTKDDLPNWDELSKSILPQAESTSREQPSMTYPVMWLTAVAAPCSGPLFALVYSYSPHETGTVRDADFWAQLQSSTMQAVSSVVVIISLWHKDKLPRWMWLVPTTVSLVCAIAAVPLYITAPSEWSVFASMISTAVQAFVVVHLAFNGVAT